MLIYYFAPFNLNNPYACIQSFKWIITLQPSKIGHVYMNFLITKTVKSFPPVMSISHESTFLKIVAFFIVLE